MATEPVGDAWTGRFVTVGLAIVLFVCVAGIIAAPLLGKDMASEVSNIALMIVAGLLALVNPMAQKGNQQPPIDKPPVA